MEIKDLTEYEEYGIKKKNVEVSIWCITYNHKDYIRKAFEGFLMQKTTFDIEIVVFDDASTDGTSDIVREYAEQYPNMFHAFILKNNIYKHPHRKEVIENLKKENFSGKYIAHCEGDDYWIYEYKLQRQYDYMEKHSEVALFAHNEIKNDEEKGIISLQIKDMESGVIDDKELICSEHGRLPTASLFYRAGSVRNKPSFFQTCPVGDDPLRWWLGYKGSVYYLDKAWSVRNFMHEGSWNKTMAKNTDFRYNYTNKYLKFLCEFDETTEYRFHKYISILILWHCVSEVEMIKGEEVWSCEVLMEKIGQIKEENFYVKPIYFDVIKCNLLLRCDDFSAWISKLIKDKNKSVYIYGAGIEGEKCGKLLLNSGVKWESFVISCKNDEKLLMGHEIISIDELQNKDAIIILGMNIENSLEVYLSLKSRKYTNII